MSDDVDVRCVGVDGTDMFMCSIAFPDMVFSSLKECVAQGCSIPVINYKVCIGLSPDIWNIEIEYKNNKIIYKKK